MAWWLVGGGSGGNTCSRKELLYEWLEEVLPAETCPSPVSYKTSEV